MDVDKMLSYAGDFGRYQWMLMLLFSVINVLSAFHYFAQTFISLTPPFSCVGDNGTHDPCHVRGVNGSLGPCLTGWQFRPTGGFNSIVTELSWVCDDAWKPVLGQSMYFVGSVVGTLGLGMLADHVGRLPILILANLVALLGNVTTAFTSGFAEFATCRFVSGLATDSNFVMMYIIVMEYMRPNMRTLGLNLCIGVFYCAGSIAVPWAAVLSVNWRVFLLAISAPMIVVPGFYVLVPESARWLLNKGRVDKAVRCFIKIASFNGKTLPEAAVRSFQDCHRQTTTPSSGTLLGLFRTPRLRRKTCILIFKSIVLTLTYDAISRNVEACGMNPFVMFSVSSATILPSCGVILLLQDRVGRKAMACFSLLGTGVFTGAAGVILATHFADPVVAAVLTVVGRFGINIAYNSGAQYAAELIPTEVRGQGVAAIHVAGYAATFFSPHILHLATYWKATPDLLLGMLAILGAILCLLLPETTDKELPVTLQDGEVFGEDETMWDFAFRRQ